MGYGNTIVLSADRNGSTAFIQNLKISRSLNGDSEVLLGECFSQDSNKNQPPGWWDPENIPPSKVVEYVNRGTGKPATIKLQLTWPTFNKTYFDIKADKRIFFHRNLFDSTLSRCVALTTGHWFTTQNEDIDISSINIPQQFFVSRLEYRIEKYLEYIEYIQNWCNEWYRYETYKYPKNLIIKPNVDKQLIVDNYQDLKSVYNRYSETVDIEKILSEKIK